MKGGVRYSNRYVHVFVIRNGKIREGWEYLDTQLLVDTFKDMSFS